MWIVRLALRKPYTFTVMAILMLIMGMVTGGYDSPAAMFLSTNTKRDGAGISKQNRIQFRMARGKI